MESLLWINPPLTRPTQKTMVFVRQGHTLFFFLLYIALIPFLYPLGWMVFVFLNNWLILFIISCINTIFLSFLWVTLMEKATFSYLSSFGKNFFVVCLHSTAWQQRLTAEVGRKARVNSAKKTCHTAKTEQNRLPGGNTVLPDLYKYLLFIVWNRK